MEKRKICSVIVLQQNNQPHDLYQQFNELLSYQETELEMDFPTYYTEIFGISDGTRKTETPKSAVENLRKY